MQKRTLEVALLAVLATVLVFGLSGLALADQTWRDLPDTVTAKYGITDNQIAGISEGFAGGLWKPFKNVTRAQFTKMAVAAFNIPLANSAIASYTDVPKTNYYYPYIEGAKAAGVVSGTTATTFSPNVNITRQQAIAIVARYIAKAQGYDLATMYTSADITALLSHFGDAASISADLKDEIAFAFDMGITNGDDFGNIKPLANLTRIQGAALLIRAQDLVPPNLWVPAKLELVSADKAEGLIGQTFTTVFRVTTADGHPAKGVLVDLDALTGAEYYVGNVSAQAAVTDDNGEVHVDLLSAEPGTQRVTATVAGVGTIFTTRYWLVLDEVYNVKGGSAQNNAGVEHTWGVRVVVFGPGPRSTSQNDWYNAIDEDFDPTDIDWEDGIDAICDDPFITDDEWSYADELALAVDGYAPRVLAGIDVEWAIYNRADNPTTKLTNEAVTSVGNIVAVDGKAISAAKSAVGKTDGAGYSSIAIISEAIGQTLTEAVADYPGNPYPEQIFNHDTFQDDQHHDLDWYGQPAKEATQTKNWIAHTTGGTSSGPISPSYVAANIGEEKTLTITLTDVYGNPKPGAYVEWFMQGVGFFQTDDSGDTSDPYVAGSNKDYDTTDSAGKATLFVKSLDSGEQIIHAKVRDKGTGGSEGAYVAYTAEVQWFDADIVTFDDIKTTDVWYKPYIDVAGYWKEQNEALATNSINTSHTFTLHVYGLKLEYDSSLDQPDGQTPYIDSDATGSSYDKIIDAKDAAYFGGILVYPSGENLSPEEWYDDKLILPWDYEFRYDEYPYWAYDYDSDGIIEAQSSVSHLVDGNDDGDYTDTADGTDYVSYDERGTMQIKVHGIWLALSFEGAYTEYDYDDDGYKEPFQGVPGIYLPLAGKRVLFYVENESGQLEYTKLTTTTTITTGTTGGTTTSTAATTTTTTYVPGSRLSNAGVYFDGDEVEAAGYPENGTINPKEGTAAITDNAGKASVTITSTEKGPETIKAVVDWNGNPHNLWARAKAYAKKTWVAGTVAAPDDVTIEVWFDDDVTDTDPGVLIATSKEGVLTNIMGTPLTGKSLAYEVNSDGDYVLNSAHWHVHVLDAYGNDLPDYEVVYLLEDINSWLGGTQDSADTYIPWAFLVDLYDNRDDTGLISYDKNGYLPDSNEPIPASDPYGRVLGPGGTPAFFFNQWLGSEKPVECGHAGIEAWWNRIPGQGFLGYHAQYLAASYNYEWPSDYYGADEMFDGFDGVIDGLYTAGPYGVDPNWPDDHVGLATDGAKAWTLDGYYDADDSDAVSIEPNLLTGSNIDIQLADAFVDNEGLAGHHLESILRVMVYAPADGLVQEGTYLWSVQVHQVWEVPVPTTIVLAPSTDFSVAGSESTTLTATVLDQFDIPMPYVDVYFDSEVLEGDITQNFTDDLVDMTDENGNVGVDLQQLEGTWGVEQVTAWVDDGTTDGLTSNVSLIQWIFDDSQATRSLHTVDPAAIYGFNLVAAVVGQQRVTMIPGFLPWNGKNIWVYANPGATGWVGAGTYVTGVGLNVTTSVTWGPAGQGLYLKANSSNTDEIPNWIYDVVIN